MYLIYLVCNKRKHWWNKCDSAFITIGIFSTPEKGMKAMKWAREHNGIGNDIKFKGLTLTVDDHLRMPHPFRDDGLIPDEYQQFKKVAKGKRDGDAQFTGSLTLS